MTPEGSSAETWKKRRFVVGNIGNDVLGAAPRDRPSRGPSSLERARSTRKRQAAIDGGWLIPIANRHFTSKNICAFNGTALISAKRRATMPNRRLSRNSNTQRRLTHGGPPSFLRLPVETTRAASARSCAARTVRDEGFADSFDGSDSANETRRVDFRASAQRMDARRVDIGKPEFWPFPQTTIKTDIHSVTRWSKLDTIWQGVSFDDLLNEVNLREAPFPYTMAHCHGGYTTNVPVADLIGGKGLIATRYDGLQIPPAHGGPARLLVPKLYFWKSAKWVQRLRFMEEDEQGFWESLGYHSHGDPWKEQRYDGD